MQHDVFLHPLRRSRAVYPFIVVLQSDYPESGQRLSAPLILRNNPTPIRGTPLVALDGSIFAVNLMEMFALPGRMLRQHRVGSIAAYRDDITRELDWLFTGI